MAIVMNMSSYEIERSPVVAAEYGKHTLTTGLNPAIARLSLQPVVSTTRQMSMPGDLAMVDIKMFLQQMSDCELGSSALI
jgi:hypothetical protein